MRASSIPNLSLRTLARGARQFVVHEALETGKVARASAFVSLHRELYEYLESTY
jgi:hypothetical protein